MPKLLARPFGYFDPTAQNFGVGIRRLAQKVFVIGLNGEKRGIYAVQNGGERHVLVSAEVELYCDGFTA